MKKASKPASANAAGKRAVMYARVSSKEQEKEGFSIPAQQAAQGLRGGAG
jgi:site-specific DNA recombinase